MTTNLANGYIVGTTGLGLLNQEAVAFQTNNNLYPELMAAFEPLVAKGKKVTTKDLEDADVGGIIARNTNLHFKVEVWAGVMNACVYPPDLDGSHIFTHDNWWFDNTMSYKLMANGHKPIKGTVDLKNSKVYGAWEEMEMVMCLGTGLFSAGFTAGEIAAITLHEIGHVMSYLEWLTAVSTVNFVLAGIRRALLDKAAVEQKVAILRGVEEILDIHLDEIDKLAKTEEFAGYAVTIIEEVKRQRRPGTGCAVYDVKSWEFASDQFAVRHGAARDLASGMLKLYKLCGSPSVSTWGLVLTSIFQALYLILLTIVSLPLAVILTLVMLLGGSPYQSTYDDDGYRIERMYRQLLEMAKDKDLSKEARKTLEVNLKAIKACRDQVKDHSDLLGWIQKQLPWIRKQTREIDRQQLLEFLGTNDLFRAGNRFKSKL